MDKDMTPNRYVFHRLFQEVALLEQPFVVDDITTNVYLYCILPFRLCLPLLMHIFIFVYV